MSVLIPYPTLTGAVDPSKLQSNFNALANKFSLGIDNSDISASAAISVDKLTASNQYMTLKFGPYVSTGSGILDYTPIFYDANGAWIISGINYLILDAGTTRPVVRFHWGNYTDGTTTLNVTSNLTAATTIGTADGFNYSGSISITTSTITPTTNSPVNFIYINQTVAGVASGNMYFSILLKRQIKA